MGETPTLHHQPKGTQGTMAAAAEDAGGSPGLRRLPKNVDFYETGN